MFLGVNMLNIYVTICKETLEVVIIDSNLLGKRSHLRSNHNFDHPLIVFVNCNWFLENTAQHLWIISLKFKYKLGILYKTQKR